MTEIKKIEIVNHDEERQAGYVTLPYDRSDFNEFIKSLLGKPQTLEGEFRGSYSLDKGDIINLHHLIEQRVQQNESTLVSLVIQIVYNDDSSITLTDLEVECIFLNTPLMVTENSHFSIRIVIEHKLLCCGVID